MDDSEQLKEAYASEERLLRLSHSKIGCIVALVLVPAGVTLDYFVYPEKVWEFLAIRMLCDLAMGVALLGHFTAFGKKHPTVMIFSWPLIVDIAISAMIFRTEGIVSPYYAGLNLVVICVTFLLPLTLKEAVALCFSTIAIYCLFAFSHPAPLEGSGDILFNNLYFLVLTGIISSTACHFNSRARLREFQLRYELDLRNQTLAEMDRLKSQFFSNISHELRTPLTLILAPIQDLLQSPELLNDRVAAQLRTARDNSLRLLKLVNDLLEVIKLEEGKSDLTLEPIKLNAFLGGVVDSMSSIAEPREIAIVKDLAATDLLIEADYYALERILLNLLSNALKFTSEGGSITLRTALEDGQVIIDVADTGIGIESKDLPHIFERFRQVDGSSTRRYQGSGLGLALVKELVENMGGSITPESQPGVGTRMRLSFPEASPAAQARPAASAPNDRSAELLNGIRLAAEQNAALPLSTPFERDESEVPAGAGAKLLIVDDEPDMRQYLVSLLEHDYRVFLARDGDQALRLAAEHSPDLMLLDLMLPGVDGLEVCRSLKNDPLTEHTKIILLTARIDEEAKITALRHGADDFLTKPFSSIEVKTRLSNLYKTASLEARLRASNNELSTTLSELKSAQSSLIHSEKLNALGNLAAGLLHEVNNPLNYVIAALQMARLEPETESNADLKEMLDDIDEGVGRIRNIVTDLRTFAHPSESDRQSAFALSSSVETAIRFTADACRSIEITQDLDPNDEVHGSPSHIVQVLVNLITNAAHALGAQPKSDDDTAKPRIHIESRLQGNRLRTSVSDNGPGIPQEVREKIFEPFFTTREVGDGMGLGLSICHTIIKSHGGDLSVDCPESGGTVFSFDLESQTVSNPTLRANDATLTENPTSL